MEQMANLVATATLEFYGEQTQPVFSRTDPAHGDFSTNIAMQLAAKVGKPPREISEQIANFLQKDQKFARVEVAGPGFINITLSDAALVEELHQPNKKPYENKTILLEYSCPNAFKELHTGHLYQTLIGDSMGRIYESVGARVFRTSFGGDVGLHAAKCMWGIIQALGGENPEKLADIDNHAAWISDAYVSGSRAYEDNTKAKAEIEQLNKRIYGLFESNDKESAFAHIYFTCRQWSYDYFDEFYASIDAKPFDNYYPESQTMAPGLRLVNEHIGSIFNESEGAIVLDESKTKLHTRVFITSAGLPTYETKDLGVIELERDQFPYDHRIIMTGNDQTQYMQVVFAAVSLINPELGAKQRHVANGTVRFGDGQKMSSRLGNVSRAVDVLAGVESAIEATDQGLKKDIALGAVKYSLLKNRVGGDIAFDLDQSINTEGNSGPYLQYALVRARAILRKLGDISPDVKPQSFNSSERALVSKMTEYSDVLKAAVEDFSPHHLCGFLYELAQEFNRFYEQNRVIGDEHQAERAVLVKTYESILSRGLDLLGIPTPEHM